MTTVVIDDIQYGVSTQEGLFLMKEIRKMGTSVYNERLDSLACCAKSAKPALKINWLQKQEQEEKDKVMKYANASAMVVQTIDNNPDQAAKSHLQTRVMHTYWLKDLELQKNFGLMDDDCPTDANEIVARVKAGKYTITEPKEDWQSAQFRWRDPAAKTDRDGYRAAKKLLDAAQAKALDEIVVLFPEQGLEAFRTFEATTFH